MQGNRPDNPIRQPINQGRVPDITALPWDQPYSRAPSGYAERILDDGTLRVLSDGTTRVTGGS